MTNSYKKDFPIFANNPWIVFLDNAASVQKPQYVIDGVSHFVANDYANIHRGLYELSERAEENYHYSKKVVLDFYHYFLLLSYSFSLLTIKFIIY